MMNTLPSCYQILEGEILQVYKVEETNFGETIVYDVIVVMPNGSKQIVTNVTSANTFGGIFDHCETVYSSSRDLQYTKAEDRLNNKGARVIIGFVGGDLRHGVILAGLRHPSQKLPLDIPDINSLESQMKLQLNGISLEFFPSGKFKYTHKGLPDRNGKFDTKVSTTIENLDDGTLKISDANKQVITIDATNKNISISNGDDSIILDQSKHGLNIIVKGDVTINADKNVTISSKKKITLDGSKGKLVLGDNKVALGTNNIELLDKMIVFFSKFFDPSIVASFTQGNGVNVLNSNMVQAAQEIVQSLKQIQGSVQ